MTPKPLNKIEDFCLKLFDLIGADENVASACVASVMHGTRFGVDSHGVRLIPHYIKVLETDPKMTSVSRGHALWAGW